MFAKIYERLVNWTSDKDHQVKLYDPDSDENQAGDLLSVKCHVLGAWESGVPHKMLYVNDTRPSPMISHYIARLIVVRDDHGLFWIRKCSFTTPPISPISVHDYAFLKTYTIPQV